MLSKPRSHRRRQAGSRIWGCLKWFSTPISQARFRRTKASWATRALRSYPSKSSAFDDPKVIRADEGLARLLRAPPRRLNAPSLKGVADGRGKLQHQPNRQARFDRASD